MNDILLEADLHACPSPLPLRDKSVLPYHDVTVKPSSNILSTMYNNTDGSIIIPNQIGLLEYDLHTPPRPMRLRDKVIITFDNTEGSIIIPSQNELLEYDLHSRPCPLHLQGKMVLSTNDVVANYNVNISSITIDDVSDGSNISQVSTYPTCNITSNARCKVIDDGSTYTPCNPVTANSGPLENDLHAQQQPLRLRDKYFHVVNSYQPFPIDGEQGFLFFYDYADYFTSNTLYVE